MTSSSSNPGKVPDLCIPYFMTETATISHNMNMAVQAQTILTARCSTSLLIKLYFWSLNSHICYVFAMRGIILECGRRVKSFHCLKIMS